jgi:hypothetical protein
MGALIFGHLRSLSRGWPRILIRGGVAARSESVGVESRSLPAAGQCFPSLRDTGSRSSATRAYFFPHIALRRKQPIALTTIKPKPEGSGTGI